MYRLLRNHVLFDADKGAGGGDPDKKPDEGKEPDAQGKGGLSQDELNDRYAERAARAAEAEKKRLYESLGIKDDAEFDAYLKAKKEAEDKGKSELQKAQDDLKAAQAEADRLKAENKKTLEDARKRVLDTEIKLAAQAAVVDKDNKVTRPAFLPAAMDEVLLLVDRSEIKDENDKFIGIEAALEKLAKGKAHLLAPTNQTTSKPGGKGTPLPQSGNKPRKPAEGGDPDGLHFDSL